MSLGTIILIILIIALLGGFSGIGGGPFYGTGYYGGGGLGLVIVILLILCCSGSCSTRAELVGWAKAHLRRAHLSFCDRDGGHAIALPTLLSIRRLSSPAKAGDPVFQRRQRLSR